ncbi:MAG: bifunctional nuclease family protein [Candidatus Eisenbacteria bacterium]|nr:bifunctional nuclease family protein [Candidatus Eisenbacteria bacterium]
MLVEVVVWALAEDQKNHVPVVILKDLAGERKLPIWIGPQEASVIAMELAERKFPRPLTHDLLNSMLRGLGAKVQRVEICDLVENTFYAKIFIDSGNGILCIDARPSDSIALALKAKARIYVDPKLFSGEFDALLSETSKAADGDDEQRAEELKDFIEKLDPRDFGKFRF